MRDTYGSWSISHPTFSFHFFSPFLKSFPFRWGTAAARPSVSGERNEEERAERSRLTIEGEGEGENEGEKKSLFLLGPFSTILGWSRKPSAVGSPVAHRWPFHTGEETFTCPDLPSASRARDGKRDLKQCAFLQV